RSAPSVIARRFAEAISSRDGRSIIARRVASSVIARRFAEAISLIAMSRIVLLSFTLSALILGCGGGDTASKLGFDKTRLEYQVIQTELKLAATEKPYLVLDFKDKEFRLMLKGAVVWNYPLKVASGHDDEIWEFVQTFVGSEHRLVRALSETHLFAAASQTPDSILAIVSDVTKFKPELLQRVIPARFQMLWGNDLILDVRSDVAGKTTSQFKNTILEVRHVLQLPFGEAHLTIDMDKTHALTLLRVAQPGLPTLIYPPA
ncbi:MAG: hypothetical protein AB1644_03990, partial [Candidatus Zixiibacteriota bacterium]